MLKVTDLEAGYGRLVVLHGLTFEVPRERVVALLGGNGAGKTTTMKTVVGLLPVQRGTIEFEGSRLDHQPSHEIFARGLALVPQGRELFPEMTVAENLEIGGLQRERRVAATRRWDEVLAYFPQLRARLRQRAGSLSGGEQQMLATARALMSRPRLLLMDEPSTGLAPLVAAELERMILRVKRAGGTILLVEQNVRLALSVADYIYIIRNGRIIVDGETKRFEADDAVFRSYIG